MKKSKIGILFLLVVWHLLPASAQKVEYVVKENDVKQFLSSLASNEMEGREAGTLGIEKAAIFLEEFLKKNQIQPYFVSYRDTLSNFKQTTYNIVGFIEGNDPVLKKEFIVLGGHYDHIGIAEEAIDGDLINNGANDDASGVTAVAEIARYFALTKSNKRSLLFVFFSAEEKGLLGSKHLSEKLKRSNFNLYSMLNFEMIGVPMKRDYTAYVSGYDTSNMADKFNEYSGKKLVGFLPEEKEFQLFYRSDNFPFYKEFLVPSQTICTFDFQNYAFYHHVSDESEKMDFSHMTTFIQDMLPVVTKMVNSETKEIVLKN